MDNELGKMPSQSTEATVDSAITNLFGIVSELESKVFGDRPSNAEKSPEPPDKVTKSRNSILDAVGRLKEVNKALRFL